MPFTLEQLRTISRLLDEVLELAPHQATDWLAALPQEHAALLPALQRMLAERLESGPALLNSGLAPVSRADLRHVLVLIRLANS